MIQYLFLIFCFANAISRSTLYCREAVDPNMPPEMNVINACWKDDFEAASNAGDCLSTSGTTMCKCTQPDSEECDLLNVWAESNNQILAYCEERVVFIPKKIVDGVEVDDETQTFSVCKKMVELNAWQPYTRAASNREAEKYANNWRSTAWFYCLWQGDYTWENDKCQDKQRYLGETCWHGVGCNGADASYDGYQLSCLDTTQGDICQPTIIHRDRPQCECGTFQPYVWFACGAASSACNGHSCVMNTGDGNYYCDYYSYAFGSWGFLDVGSLGRR